MKNGLVFSSRSIREMREACRTWDHTREIPRDHLALLVPQSHENPLHMHAGTCYYLDAGTPNVWTIKATLSWKKQAYPLYRMCFSKKYHHAGSIRLWCSDKENACWLHLNAHNFGTVRLIQKIKVTFWSATNALSAGVIILFRQSMPSGQFSLRGSQIFHRI